MPTTFSFADHKVMTMLRQAISNWHPHLEKAGVEVGILFAFNDDGPAVKHGGYPAIATMKVVSLRDRVAKKYEAELLIDQTEWSDMEEDYRMPLLDHELCHIDTIPLSPEQLAWAIEHKKPTWKTDALERPRLKIVKGDWNIGDGFKAVCGRHGKFALEFHHLEEGLKMAKRAVADGPPVTEEMTMKA